MSDPTRIDIHSVDPTTDPYVRTLSGWLNHSQQYVEMPFITEVVPGLYHGGVESGLELPGNIQYVLSLYPWEKYTEWDHAANEYLQVEMYDAIDQDMSQVDELAEWVNAKRKLGNVLVHCQAGINRSSLIVGRALYLNGDVASGDEAIRLMRERRSPGVLSNPTFERFVQAQGQE